MRLTSAMVLLCFCSFAGPALADDAAVPAQAASCATRLLHPRNHDEQSVRDAEHAWLVSEMSGDTDTLGCILDDSYTNLSFDGKTYLKADIVRHAATRKGKNLSVPVVVLTILVQGHSATAYSVQQKHDQDGKPLTVYFADSLEFRNGAWHPYFSVDSVAAAPGIQIKD